MSTILIVESNPASRPQAAPDFVAALAALQPAVKTRIVTPYDTPVADADLEDVSGAIFTGSGVDWCVDAPEAAPLRAVMERVFARSIPSYGSCNGMQMAAVVLGGASAASPNGRENGLARAVSLTEAGRTHPFLEGRSEGYAVPCIHRDEVTRLPAEAVLLAGNSHSLVQAFAYDAGGVRFWGVQYHPEVSPASMADVLTRIGGHDAAEIADLRAAETNADAARRLGAAPEDMQPAMRLTEIRNWLASLPG